MSCIETEENVKNINTQLPATDLVELSSKKIESEIKENEIASSQSGKIVTKSSHGQNATSFHTMLLSDKKTSLGVPQEKILIDKNVETSPESTVETEESSTSTNEEVSEVPALSSIKENPVKWEDCSNIGDIIEGTCIMPMKTPKCASYGIPKDKRFACSDVLDIVKEKGKKVGAVISVDFTSKYYDRRDFKKNDIQYRRITDYNVDFPETDGLFYFQKTIRKFEQEFPDSIVLVHCYLGLDRSAHFICSYLVKQKGCTPEEALRDFEKARGHPIYNRKNCLKFLKEFQHKTKKDNHYESKRFPPDRWLDYSKVGDLVSGSRFLAIKVPLKNNLTKGVNDDDKFTCEDVVELLKKKGHTIGMIVDLTDTDKYYQPETFVNMGILHRKLRVPGQVIPPKNLVFKFKTFVRDFEDGNKHNKNVIVVHCTHGLNRTGYFICKYIIDELGVKAEEAIARFNEARGHIMERENYLQDLCKNVVRKRPVSSDAGGETAPKRSSCSAPKTHGEDFNRDVNLQQKHQEPTHLSKIFDKSRSSKRSFRSKCHQEPTSFSNSRSFKERCPFHSEHYQEPHYDSRSFKERCSDRDFHQESRFSTINADEILSSIGRPFHPVFRAEQTDLSTSLGHSFTDNRRSLHSDRHQVEERFLYNDPSSKVDPYQQYPHTTRSSAEKLYLYEHSSHSRGPAAANRNVQELTSSGYSSCPSNQYSCDDISQRHPSYSSSSERNLRQQSFPSHQQ